MALERSNPLPPNARYWVHVPPADQPAFAAWIGAYKGAVKVRTTQRDPDNGWDWVLFEVVAPLVWWEGPGLPTKAESDVKSESDVVQVPVVESATAKLERLGESVTGASSRLAVIGVAIVVAAVVLGRVMR